jgi:hypothetical protein
MAVIKDIAIGMSVDPNPLVRGCDRSAKAMDEFNKSAERTKGVMDGLDLTPKTSGTGEATDKRAEAATSQAQEQAGQVRAAFQSAMAPLATFAARIEAQFNRVGGTIVTLARRIDSEMKFKAFDATLTTIQEKLKTSFAKGAVGAIQSVNRIKNVLDSLGDVARRPLDRLFKFNATGAIQQTRQLSTQFSTVGTVATKAGAAVKGFGAQLTLALGVFGLAFKAVQFFKTGITEASNLNESVNKLGVIYRAQAGVVGKAADEMAAKFGTVKTSFIDTASTFGQLLQGMGGQTEKASAETSVKLAKLAADASSIFNVGFDEAAGKIASALRGQSEPISAFGIDVQEAATKAEALRLGIIKTSRDLTTQEKVAARTSLILRGLAVAEGDLAATIEAPANAFRRFQGNLINTAGSIGTTLLPAIQKGIGLLNEFASWVGQAFERNKGAIDTFVSNLGQGIDMAGAILRNLPVAWEIVKLKFIEGASNILSVIETIPANLKIIGEWVKNNWSQLIVDGVKMAGSAFENLGVNIGNLWTAMQDFLSGKGFNFEFTPLLDGFKATAEKLPDLVKPAFVSMQKEIDAQLAILNKDVADRAAKGAAAAQAVRAKPPGPLELADAKDKKDAKEGPMFAGALLAGSAEAYSAQLRFAAMGETKDEPIKDVAKKAGEQVDLTKQLVTGINKLVDRAGKAVGGAVAEVFAF